jgi:transposase
MPFHPCRESEDDRAIVLIAYWATGAMMPRRSQGLVARHIIPFLAKRNTEHGSGLGRWRWVVERTFAWLNQFRRLRVRYEKRADIHEAFLSLACALLCWNFLERHYGERIG